MKIHYVHDYETLSNCFVAYFEHYKIDEGRLFVVHSSKNQLPELIEFLEENISQGCWHISYNGLAFDSQITHWILDHKDRLLDYNGDDAARAIYEYAQYVINIRNDYSRFLDYPSWKMKIKQIDIFKLNHWDGKAKSCSLKWIQYSTDWENIEEMPIHHTTEIKSPEEIDTIVNYCINDVRSTKAIMHLSREQIELRLALSKEYNLDLNSASEPRISKELFAHFLSTKLGIDKKELKKLRTHREKIDLKDIILPNIKFQTEEFKQVLDWFSNLTVYFNNSETDGDREKKYKYRMIHKNVPTDYGLGGIHGATDSGIYEATNGMIIMSSDVTSFYPNLAIRNGFHPAHISRKEFLEQYEWFFEERKKIPKSNPKNYIYKIILNSTYGLSKDINSFLYDPAFTMSITVNGQLQLSMLYEMLSLGIPGSIPLMQNTDGLEMMIPAEYKDRYLEICEEWEKLTNLQLEHDQYQKMFIWDVNNYIAVYTNGKTKCKGRFEWEDLDKKKTAVLHKNKSFLVIPKAIYNYFVNGILPEDYLEQNKNIYDYCAGVKAKGDWRFEAIEISHTTLSGYSHYTDQEKRDFLRKNGWETLHHEDNWIKKSWNNIERAGRNLSDAFLSEIQQESIIKRTPLQKVNRYYISKDGVKLMKVNTFEGDGRKIQVESGRWKQTICNDMRKLPKDFDTLGINKDYYLQEIYKEINTIKLTSRTSVQTELPF